MRDTQSILPIESKAIQRIVLFGASKINYFLAKLLEKSYRVIIIESEHEKSDRSLSFWIIRRFIMKTSFTSNLLDELLINEHDYFIAATENDEVNLLSSIVVKDMGLAMIACIIHRSYLRLSGRKSRDLSGVQPSDDYQ